MFLGFLYLIGRAACLVLPRPVCYWVACRIGDFCCWRSAKDREAVRSNLVAILETDKVPMTQVREVFQNFGMYLVDFFRLSCLTPQKMRGLVQMEGVERMKEALGHGCGAIGLTAHIGNYELAGAVLALLGLPLFAVVLTHQNSRVDHFFHRQRDRVGVQGIPIQRMSRKAFFERCFSVLRRNQILGLVGDRDFFGHGIELSLFGQPFRVPTGPASLSLKTGAPIVPTFLIRDGDGAYRLIIEPPIPIPRGVSRDEAIHRMTQACLDVMAQYIRRYPTQWYLFQEYWKPAPSMIL